MRLKPSAILFPAICLLAIGTATAQTKLPPETRNAALRYWLAFAELQDPPADPATQALLEKTAAGETAWDESKLGPILDKNRAAILRMQRATKLPDYDWGLEYNWQGSIAYAPRARVLARLNTLHGFRLAAQGDRSGAVSAWLDGIRFSQHVAQGGTLIFAVIAQSALLPNLRALAQAAESGSLNEGDLRRIQPVVRALPESGFDWAGAMRMEETLLYAVVDEMAQSPTPEEVYADAMGGPAPQNFSIPSAADRAAYHRLMNRAEEALRLPPVAANARLRELGEELSSGQIHWFFRQTTPSLIKVNEARVAVALARTRIAEARQGLVQAPGAPGR